MRFLLLICDEQKRLTPRELAGWPEHTAWLDDVTRRGVFTAGGQLRPGREAATVRVRAGETLVTDGPFAETKDLVGGVALLECADLKEAIEVAARHPLAAHGTIEVRPIWDA
jgi:hypothetical protein